jgi:hypothetical protein
MHMTDNELDAMTAIFCPNKGATLVYNPLSKTAKHKYHETFPFPMPLPGSRCGLQEK